MSYFPNPSSNKTLKQYKQNITLPAYIFIAIYNTYTAIKLTTDAIRYSKRTKQILFWKYGPKSLFVLEREKVRERERKREIDNCYHCFTAYSFRYGGPFQPLPLKENS